MSRFMPVDRTVGEEDARAPRTQSGRATAPSPEIAYTGEVVEASTTEIVAQARYLHGAPFFGCFVLVRSDLDIFGIVFNASTQSIEPNRRPTAYGKSEEELRREQPQIFELLRTHFSILVTGYLDDDGLPVHTLAPQPARIHSFVSACDDELVCQLSEGGDYLRCILDASGVPTDDLVIASLREAMTSRTALRRSTCPRAEEKFGVEGHLAEMGKDLARQLSGDYNRLTSLMRRIESCAGRGIK